MTEKKEKKKKPSPKISQKERFIKYARQLEADETGERFNEAMKKIAAKKTDG